MHPSLTNKQGFFNLSSSAWLLLLALLPALYQLFAVIHYGVDLPFMDDWAIAPMLVRFNEGTLTVGDLFRQQVEHRQFFPNMVFVALGWLTDWDVRYAMLCSFLLALLVFFSIRSLGESTLIEFSARWRNAILILAALLVFSPKQYDNWLFGIQLVYYVPVACVTACLVIARRRWNRRLKFFLCACLSVVSAFSSANGMLCWIITLPALTWSDADDKPSGERSLLVGAWVVITVLSGAFYFYSYHKPASSPSIELALEMPLKALLYFATLLGAPLGHPFFCKSLRI